MTQLFIIPCFNVQIWQGDGGSHFWILIWSAVRRFNSHSILLIGWICAIQLRRKCVEFYDGGDTVIRHGLHRQRFAYANMWILNNRKLEEWNIKRVVSISIYCISLLIAEICLQTWFQCQNWTSFQIQINIHGFLTFTQCPRRTWILSHSDRTATHWK